MEPNLAPHAMSSNAVIAGQVGYLIVTVAMTVWVARILHASGKALLAEAFPGKDDLAASINKLLVVGFYLLNFGFVCLQLSDQSDIESAPGLVRAYSLNIGWVMLAVGGMHMLNVYIFNRFRKGGQRAPRSYPSQGAYRVPPVNANYALPPEAAPQAHGLSAAELVRSGV